MRRASLRLYLRRRRQARDEERVAREDHISGLSRSVRGGGRVGHVVADRVLGVAGRCDTPGESPRPQELN